MSEEKATAGGDGHGEKKKPAAPAPLILAVVGLVGLLAGAGAGVFVVAPRFMPASATAGEHGEGGGDEKGHGKKKDDKGHGKKDEKGKKEEGGHGEKAGGSVYRVDNLIVNPAGSMGQRFLMATVAFDFSDPKLNEEVRAREVEVRDRIIATFESQTLEDLTRPGARDSLRAHLHAAILPIAGEDAEFEVYLPQFVIQ